MLKFEVEKQSGLMRAGTIHTPHGDIKTPAFVGAATRSSVKGITWSEMKKLGSEAVLANTYHLLLAPGVDLIQNAGGLAKFSGWSGPTFTDSGGFQIFSLPNVKITEEGARFKSYLNGDSLEITPESSMLAQWKIGADIHMAFDELTKSDFESDMKSAMDRTHRWLDRCLIEHKKQKSLAEKNGLPEQFLYAVVQGGTFLNLREESARYESKLDVDGFGIGGVFTAKNMDKMLKVVNNILPNEKPRHLLGMGQEPLDLFVGAEFGCDTFDCVGPTRMARNGSLYTHHGRINIRNAKFREDFSPIDPECDCELCKNHTAAYLHHLFKVNELTAKVLASLHNERFIVRLTSNIRKSILNNTFQEFKNSFLSSYYSK